MITHLSAFISKLFRLSFLFFHSLVIYPNTRQAQRNKESPRQPLILTIILSGKQLFIVNRMYIVCPFLNNVLASPNLCTVHKGFSYLFSILPILMSAKTLNMPDGQVIGNINASFFKRPFFMKGWGPVWHLRHWFRCSFPIFLHLPSKFLTKVNLDPLLPLFFPLFQRALFSYFAKAKIIWNLHCWLLSNNLRL